MHSISFGILYSFPSNCHGSPGDGQLGCKTAGGLAAEASRRVGVDVESSAQERSGPPQTVLELGLQVHRGGRLLLAHAIASALDVHHRAAVQQVVQHGSRHHHVALYGSPLLEPLVGR